MEGFFRELSVFSQSTDDVSERSLRMSEAGRDQTSLEEEQEEHPFSPKTQTGKPCQRAALTLTIAAANVRLPVAANGGGELLDSAGSSMVEEEEEESSTFYRTQVDTASR